jgi:hypothetical protein
VELKFTTVVSDINPDIGDLALGDDHDEVVLTELRDEAAQRLFCRLNFFQGEWFRDASAGTPYYQHILRKGVNDRLIRTIFSQVILGTEGIEVLKRFTYTVNRQRQMFINFEAVLADGTVFKATEYPPFQVLA